MNDFAPIQTPLLINGVQIHSHERAKHQPVTNPATGGIIGQVTHATPADLDAAVHAAQAAFDGWRNRTPQARGQILVEAARLLRQRADDIARLVTAEVGKPHAQGHKEAIVAAETLEWFAEQGKRIYGHLLPGRHEGVQFSVMQAPIGVAVALATWNFPVINAARKIGAALGAGCTCVYKPDELAPASGSVVAQALVDAGLPPGVLAIVFGEPAQVSAHLLACPQVRKLSFTGSIPVGRQLMALAAQHAIRCTMELGGHAPVIVCKDADVDAVARQAVASKFRNAGQVCVAPTRFLVAEPLFPRFVRSFTRYTRQMRVGNAALADVDMGPLIHERRRQAVHALVEDAVEQGASLLTGGSHLPGPGWFYQPTVLSQVPLSARAMIEEPFGPVALINPYRSLDEAIEEANRLPFGLAAYAFTNHCAWAQAIKERVEAGMLAINSFVISRVDAPFSGIKDSGQGAENGIEGIQDYLVTKSVSETHPLS